MKIVNETDVPEKLVPGRFIRWIADGKTLQPKYLSSCIIRVMPGQTVQPAHSHPEGEELVYIMSGRGQAWVDGEIRDIREGTAVLFREKEIHMLRNVGDVEMKVICFFAPATSLEEYRFHEGIEFREDRSFGGERP